MKNLTKFEGIIAIGAVIMFGLVFGLGLMGCATTVPIKSVRAPTIDTSNVQRLAIKDFENKSGVSGPLGEQIMNYLTTQSKQIITNAQKFTLTSAADSSADGVFTGELTSIAEALKSEAKQRRNSDGSVTNYTEYTRTVRVAFSYSVLSSRTQMLVGIVTKSGTRSTSGTQGFDSLTSPIDMAKRIVDDQLKTLHQDVVPTIVATNRKLMKETSKDKAVKQLMKTAQALVKNYNYEEAIRQYDQIGSEYGSVAARTNANILREAIASDIAARAELAELFNDKDGLAEKAAKGAVAALNSKLPSGTTIMITKSDNKERSRLDYVVDQMTKTIVQEGKLKVADRGNQALIQAEQQFQLSGNVSDDQAVSIGRQLGVHYIVLCWISGEMSTRRLNIRALNVETAQITTQNDFEI